MATNHIPQIVEALQRSRLAVFVGGDLPPETTGLPSRADLAAELARRLDLAGPAPPWPEIAARYEASAGLNALISWLRDQLDAAGHGSPFDAAQGKPAYHLLAQLPVNTYITTAYDSGLHEALREAGRRPSLPVVDAASLGLLDADRPTVVHLFGTYDRPGSLVLTAAHLRQTRSCTHPFSPVSRYCSHCLCWQCLRARSLLSRMTPASLCACTHRHNVL